MSHLQQLSPRLYRLSDTCNVYLITSGDAGLIVDAGSGAILEHAHEAGVRQIEWVLHTHHHRDQCWGTPRVQATGAQVAVPEYEQHLFAEAQLFWQTRRTYDNYDDRNNFFSSARDIPVDAVLEDYEVFEWRDLRFTILPAKGHTGGSSTMVVELDGKTLAFSGDLMASGGTLYQLHAMEYTYGSMEGIMFSIHSIRDLVDSGALVAYPSHGEAITDVPGDAAMLQQRLMDLVHLGRGLRVGGRESVPEATYLPEGQMIQLSRHLLWGGPWTCSNFYVVLRDSGKAMFVDYGHRHAANMHTSADHGGLESMRFVQHHLRELRDRWGVTAFDLVVPTHIHDDHTCGIPYLQRHHDTRCWALREVGQVLADPASWASTPCVFPKPIRIDRWLEDGDTFRWQEFEFEIYHAPGQTEFHSVYAGMIDGRKVAFTGDNWFSAEVAAGGKVEMRPFETTVLRNSFTLEMHQRCATVMRRIRPELICPGHREVLRCDKGELDAYVDFIQRKERVFRALVPAPANHHIDLFWARLLPYLHAAAPGETLEYRLLLRNNLERSATYAARLLPPEGWQTAAEPISRELAAGKRGELRLAATAPDRPDPIRKLLTAEILVDGVSQGPLSEALVTVKPAG